jgi:hypothetical protein
LKGSVAGADLRRNAGAGVQHPEQDVRAGLGPVVEGIDSGFLAHGARDKDKGCVMTLLLGACQCGHTVIMWQRIVSQDKIGREFPKLLMVVAFGFNAPRGEFQPVLAELAQDQIGVIVGILQK